MLKKRSISIVLAIVMLLSLFPMGTVWALDSAAAAAEAEEPEATAATAGLQAGAGVAEIDFTHLFDEENGGPIEGFYGVEDNPRARVLLLETDERVAIVSVELVNCPDEGIQLCREIVSEITDTPIENVWVHATHAITTPHYRGSTTQQAMYMDALGAAAAEAAEQAAGDFQPAVAGAGSGYLDINANRNIWIGGTPYYGLGSTYGESDKELSVFYVESAQSGEAIGFLLNYGMKPDVINNTQQSVDGRLVSPDAPGYASLLLEEKYGAPALYLMGAAADQIPIETSDYYTADPETGAATRIQLPVEEGLEMAWRLGGQMADAVEDIVADITPDQTNPVISLESSSFTWATKSGGTASDDVRVMRIGDLALVGLKPEVNALTGLELKGASPFENTMVVSFLDGNNKYLPDAQAYDDNTYEISRSDYAQGAAEEFVRVAAGMLEDLLVVDAADAVEGVHAIGYMAADGAKLHAIAVEYNVDLTGADVDADTYDIDYWTTTWNDYCINFGDGEIGDILAVYVNDEPDVSETGGTGTGNYVIIEVYTDYQYASEPSYLRTMSVGAAQNGDIAGDNITVTGDGTAVTNYTGSGNNASATYGTYTIKGIEGYRMYTNEPGVFGADGPAHTAYDCFNEKDGTTYDYDLGYNLYVPEDYDPDGSYAMVTVNHTISEGTHPYESLVSNYGPAYFITDEAQQVVKDAHGLDGLIVVVPQIIERVDDNSCVPAMWMALVELWDKIAEEYNVDENHIYGAGQSMGGMLLMQTNTNRDNYFAGILCYGNQWGQNYYKDTVFARGMSNASYNETAENTPRHYPSTAGTYYIWDYHYDSGGEMVYDGHDPYNFYYLISDDNLMVLNGSTNALSNDVWQEMSYLYTDLVGYSIPHLEGMDAFDDLDAQNQYIHDFLEEDNNTYNGAEMGLYWLTWEAGANDATAIWSRRVTAGYEWLLSQDRETEMEREKLDLNKPFEPADEQITDETRVVDGFYDKDTGEDIYYLTGKAGSGTQFYNTSWLQAGSNVPADANPGWLPEGMSHPVSAALIQSVTPISDGGVLTAVAIEYSVDMENLVIHLVGDNVIDSKGNPRADDFVTIAPYDFYDENGDEISAEITNVYVGDSPAVIPGAARESGAGNYVIVELDTASDAEIVGVIQRTTVRTDASIASATSKLYLSEDVGDTAISADDAIEGVHAIGFVDTDGAKLSAIAVEYNVDLTGADVSIDSYEITNYAIGLAPEIGSDPGVVTSVYVNDEAAVSETGGTGTGSYVIIEVNTDYQLGNVASSYQLAMIAGVTQVGTVTAGGTTITPGTGEVSNYTGSGSGRRAIDGTYSILGTEVFDLYTKEDGTAFYAEDCWEEATGQLVDVELPYALYVPEDYDDSKSYALVLHVHDAGFLGDDPMITLTESQGAVNFASDEVQQIVKDAHGLDGMIVVAPQINSDLRSTRDDYSLSAAVPATWQLMDYLTEEYSIDMDRIYGEGQSMGGMQVVAMAAQRDNYFAGLWANGCQWGSNFNLEDPTYNGTPYYAAPADGEIIWTVDADGNEVDYRNWYYLVSDDNILITNCMSDNFSTSVWKEFKYLYRDLAGAEIPYTSWDPLTETKDAQSDYLRALTAQENDLGIYWYAFSGGSHMATWIYSHGVMASYEWLLTQTRESSMEREKLDLNKPFELADEQLEEEDRLIASGSAYLVTGKYGAGTLGYNSALYGRGGGSLIQPPGWSIAVEDVVIDGLVLQSVAVGKELQLGATVTPANATYGSWLTWTSTNTNYATVEDGVVTGVAPGTVIITATANNGVSYSMRVKVTAF